MRRTDPDLFGQMRVFKSKNLRLYIRRSPADSFARQSSETGHRYFPSEFVSVPDISRFPEFGSGQKRYECGYPKSLQKFPSIETNIVQCFDHLEFRFFFFPSPDVFRSSRSFAQPLARVCRLLVRENLGQKHGVWAMPKPTSIPKRRNRERCCGWDSRGCFRSGASVVQASVLKTRHLESTDCTLQGLPARVCSC